MSENTKYFYDTKDFPFAEKLERNWKLIRDELSAIINEPASVIPKKNWVSPHPQYVKNDEKSIAWKTFDFVFFGIQHLENSNRCPKTMELLKTIPQLVTAEFSVIEPHTHILPHKGFTRMVLRCHLGLIIPDKMNCGIRVGNEIKNWEEGKLMIFDDSEEHEAWNKSDKMRGVLMFDVPNPAMKYTAQQICRYKLENLNDSFLLNIADKQTWVKWFEQGHFPKD